MPLSKSHGNMYDWVTHMHSHLEGGCAHKCRYCFVLAMERRHQWGRYTGNLRLREEEFKVKYGSGRTIFIEHMNDLFAYSVNPAWVVRVLAHCEQYLGNKYVFQTKNPSRVHEEWLVAMTRLNATSKGIFIGTTVESNYRHAYCMGSAPEPRYRLAAIAKLRSTFQTFITVEPILDCDPVAFADMIAVADPVWVNIGADSKGHNLLEPNAEKLAEFINRLDQNRVRILKKTNLTRLLSR